MMTSVAIPSMEAEAAVSRALQLLSDAHPEAAAGAQVTLNRLLCGIRHAAKPAEAWGASALGRTGFPLEFAFCSADASVRYACDICAPEVPPRQRLDHALRLLQELELAPVPVEMAQTLSGFQVEGALKYGAWISGRHTSRSSRYKLYAEVPEEGADAAEAWGSGFLGAFPVTPCGSMRVVMIGYTPETCEVEVYYQVEELPRDSVRLLMQRVDIAHRAEDCLDLLQDAYGLTIRRMMPSSTFGFSYAMPADSALPVFTLYTFANSLWGGDGPIREALLALGERRGWEWSWYEALSEPLAGRLGWVTHHGLFGVVIRENTPAAATFGVTPPPGGRANGD